MPDLESLLLANPRVDRQLLQRTREIMKALEEYGVKVESHGIEPPFKDSPTEVESHRPLKEAGSRTASRKR